MKKIAMAALAAISIAVPSFAQTVMPSRSTTTAAAGILGSARAAASAPAVMPGGEATERLQFAISSVDYPVTPSDVYLLTYRQSSGEVVMTELQVPGSSTIDLGFFGIIDASRLTFLQLKDRVETLVAGSYSRSYPALAIESVGSFRVSVGGAGMQYHYVNAWGLSRLSDILGEVAVEARASLRRVELVRSKGERYSCDVLMARQSAGGGADPFLRPGDTITLHPAGQSIRLSGEVRRPGSYELMEGEGLKELIDTFGGGISDIADQNSVRMDMGAGSSPYAEYLSLQEAYAKYPKLESCAGVTIFSKDDRQPIVYFEGAVSGAQGEAAEAGRAAAAGASMTAQPWIACPIVEGQRLSDALASIRGRLAPLADLSSATLIRVGAAPMQVDLASLLARRSESVDFALMANDRIYIPELNSLVTVTGAVNAPGAFAFQPTAPASFYITRAGGIDPERNDNGAYWVSDQKGKKRNPNDPLEAGDRIYVPANAFGYNFVRYLPVVTGVITMLISIETLLQLINANINAGI